MKKLVIFLLFSFLNCNEIVQDEVNSQNLELKQPSERNLLLTTPLTTSNNLAQTSFLNQQPNILETAAQAQQLIAALQSLPLQQLAQQSQLLQNSQQNQFTNPIPQQIQSQTKENEPKVEEKIQIETEKKEIVKEKKEKERKLDQYDPELTQLLIKYKYVCLLKSDFCKVNCLKNCEQKKFSEKLKKSNQTIKKEIEKEDCNKCELKCKQSVSEICIEMNQKDFIPISKEAFYTFRNDNKKCLNRGYVCSKLCFLDYCQNSYSPECAQCKVDCDKGAESGCFISQNSKEFTKFEIIYKDFSKGNGKLKCNKCASESAFYCKNECGKNYSCKRECLQKSQIACESLCKGNKDYYYNFQLTPVVKNMIRVIQGNCTNCEDLCDNEVKIECYEGDKTCSVRLKKFCRSSCLMKFCSVYQEKMKKKKERELWFKGGFGHRKLNNRLIVDNLQLIMSRLKAHQRVRNKYDEENERKARTNAFMQDRRTLIQTLDYTEENIYKSTQENQQNDSLKSGDFEKRFEEQMKMYLADQASYDKIENPSYRIFDDQFNWFYLLVCFFFIL